MSWIDYYNKGWPDWKIAMHVCAAPATIFRWRKKLGLPANTKVGKLQQLYLEGYSDSQITAMLKCNKSYPRWWRMKHGNLPPNRKKVL